MSKPIDTPIMELAERRGKDGFAVYEMSGLEARVVYAAVVRLVREGKLWRGRIAHKTVRFFCREEWARHYEARRTIVKNASNLKRAKADWPADAPAHYPVDESGRPLYKVTIAPPPAPSPVIRTDTHSPF